MKEAERVRLHNLCQSEDAAQLVSRGRDTHGEQLIASLGGCDEMADRADAADPGHQGGHLIKGPTLAELLKAAKLGDVKVGVVDSSLFVEVEGNFGMALDAGYGVDQDGSIGRVRQN